MLLSSQVYQGFLSPPEKARHHPFESNQRPPYPPNRVRSEVPVRFLRNIMYTGSVLTVLDTLGADYDEEEEEVTLEVMASQWGSARRRLEGMHKDIISESVHSQQ